MIEEDLEEVVEEVLVGCAEHQGDAGGIEVQALPTNLRLSFQATEVIMGELLESGVLSGHNHSFDGLGKEELVVERDKTAFVP